MFALRASHATRVRGSLVNGPTTLKNQSCCDSRCETHGDGWGVGYYTDGRPTRVRSVRAAAQDPAFAAAVEPVASTAVLAHVRKSSVGGVAERNSHPYAYGRWLFAHNGTLFGFAEERDRLRSLIPEPLLQAVEGDTDSAHAFMLILARLREVGAPADGPADPDAVSRAVADVMRRLREMFPGKPDEASQLNFVLTDGQTLVASRWGYTLYRLERNGFRADSPDEPVGAPADYRAVAVASEPTTAEAWKEVPDGAVVCVRPDWEVKMMRV